VLVSCIMPTQNRREFIPRAIKCYLAQDWPEKELIVIDTGKDQVSDLFEGVPGAKYFFHTEERPAHLPSVPIGTKRNMACERASGEVIIHWDDDDWSAPGRITDQVSRLIESGKDISGYHSMLFWDQVVQRASKYIGHGKYSLGSALCYRRKFWEGHKFNNTSFGEDNDFVSRASDRIVSVDAGQMMVALTHASNSCERRWPPRWPEVPAVDIPKESFEAIQP
jgi:glycosyltransferase involved in cell wall biosynthesis